MKSPTLPPFVIIAFSMLLTPCVTPAADILTGLVSYWPLEVNSGGTTPDSSFANNLTVNGAPTIAAGQFGNAYTFSSATSDYLSISHGFSNLDTGLPIYAAGSYTICLWVSGLGSQGTARYVFTEASTASNNPLLVFQTGNAAATRTNLDIIIRNDSGTLFLNHVISTAPVFNGVWHHIAWVDNKGSCKLYIDGNLDTNFTYTATGTFSFNTTTLGALVRAATSGLFTGSIDEVGLWERALSQSEIQQVRTNGIPTPVPVRAPILVSEPASITKHVGDWALFSAGVIGNRPFAFQWFKNGSVIPDGTSATYRASNLNTNNSGDFYSVTVTNSAGSASSSNAVITVLPDAAPAVGNGIISYWPLNEATNTPAVSPDLYSGNFMALSNMDANALVIGEFGNALSFDGLSQFTSRLSGIPIYNNSNYSISMWVKGDATSQNDRRVYSEANTTNANPLFTIGTDPAGASQLVTIDVRNDANVTTVNARKSTRVAFDNNWHHLVWTDANGQGKLYIDGALDETDFTYTRAPLSPNTTSLGAVLRGAVVNNTWFFGAIDEVATWNRVLSWTEIQQVMTNGVPVPVAAIAPTIAFQPADQTNGIFTGDAVGFSVQANGTAPLSYQWRKNGIDISGVLNPSALTNVLSLTNVQPVDAAGYSVVISNVAGSITSSVAQLLVIDFTPVTNGVALLLDIAASGQPNAFPGFAEMSLITNPTNVGSIRVTVSPIGAITLADRLRIAPPWVTNIPPYFNQAQLLNDFIFANSTTDGTGLQISLGRLAPNTKYGVTIWSFDANSAGARFSDWIETSSGTPISIQTGYNFDGNFQPTNDFEQTLGGILTSSATGTLQIEGVRNGGTSFAVFFNAIRLVANPVPTSKITRVESLDGNVVLTAVGEYPNQAITFEQNSNLVGGTWVPAQNMVFSSVNGMVVKQAFPITESQLFYRAVSPTP